MTMGLPPMRAARIVLQERIAVFTMDRDDVRNELTGSGLADDICDAIQWANQNLDVSVMIITGAGTAFSAGGNIKDMLDSRGLFDGSVSDIERSYRNGIQKVPLAMMEAEIPIIAAVNGPAIGAGCDLTCMCDLRIASEHALWGETFINLGIIPGDGGAWLLQRLIGYQKAVEMAFTGRLVRAPEAVDMGLALKMVPHENLMGEAMTLAREIAAKPPQSVRYTKKLLRQAQRMELKEFLDLCAVYQGMSHKSADHREALQAFVEKRQGQYKGY